MDKELETIIRALLHYSFEDIRYQYDGLTFVEKRLVTREQFGKLLVWLGRKDQ